MPWPKGKPRPEKDRKAISRGKTGIVPTQAHRDAVSEGQKRAWLRRPRKAPPEEGKPGSSP